MAKKTTPAKSARKTTKTAKPVADRSANIAKSWKNKDVAAARNTKDKVIVGNDVYRSVSAAFEDLKLPASKVIAFRKELKASNRATFVTDKGRKINFAIAAKD